MAYQPQIAENEILIEHGFISICPFLLWRGRVIVTFDGKAYIRLHKRRFSIKKAKDDAREFAEWASTEFQKMDFKEVKGYFDGEGNFERKDEN